MATLESTAAQILVEAPATAGRRPAVEVRHLRKTYGMLVAVDDVSFTVTEGEIFGILGPNGAGKTTAIECAIGLRRAAAAPVGRAGPDRPAGDRGAGRDDHRPGPAGPPGHLGADRAHPRPRRDDRPGDPLHGRGRTALRPGRPDRPRARGRAGHPGPPGRPGP